MDPSCWRKGYVNDSGRRSVGAHRGISDGAAPVPSEMGRAQRRVDGVMRLERASGGRATGGGTDKSGRGREDKHTSMRRCCLCLAFETQIK